ncbi:M20 family metallopeptidase [Clostridiaceae bacterium HSG29]|nr:M20 family metallopeptidase [Clostridiaceae bacterium HSG29]
MYKINEEIDKIFNELIELSEYIYNNPELGNQEFLSSKAHIDFLTKYGFKVEEHFIGIETAFKAVYDSNKPGPTIALLDEYDALPGVGHGCGHNMIGAVGTGTGIIISKFLDEIGGKIFVIGTPAEETNGAKVDMANQGVFNDIDAVLMAHPADESYASIQSLAIEAIEFEFIGKAAHAASDPEKGINALDAVIGTFNGINALRQHIESSARIHGIITEGGVAANIVPEKAVANFYVRATTKKYLTELIEKVKNCARAGALSSGAELKISNYEKTYDNFASNKFFDKLLLENMKKYDVEQLMDNNTSLGSLDAGNVSHKCPAVHPMFSISKTPLVAHTKEFAKATLTSYAYKQMKSIIGALSQTGIDLLTNADLLKKIKSDFDNAIK